MGNGQNGALVRGEIVFQPEQRFDVEMVGRFVENEQFGLFEKQPTEFQARLFSAGHGGNALSVKFPESHAVQNGADANFVMIAVARGDLPV